WPERDVRNTRSEKEREQNQRGRDVEGLHQARLHFALQENRLYAHANGCEGRAVQGEGITDVVHRCRAEHQADLLPEGSAHDFGKVRAGRKNLSHQFLIVVQERLIVVVDDADVINVSPVSRDGLHQVIEIDVGLNVLRKGALYSDWIVGVDLRA